MVVEYNDIDDTLFIDSNITKRVDVSKARNALSGYQKGRCFYCNNNYSIQEKSKHICHVDHFLPHKNKLYHGNTNINGVWNLVLACKVCNSTGQKGAKIPSINFLEKLHKRNEYYIKSKHPLAETIINQTGKSEPERISHLNKHYQIGLENSLTEWKPNYIFNGES